MDILRFIYFIKLYFSKDKLIVKHIDFSVYPTLLELVVECTYPIDQATSSALLFLSSSIQGVMLMATERFLYRPLSEKEMEKQTCSDREDFSHETAQDYTPFVIFITSYVAFFVILYALFFDPEMKRSNADHQPLEKKEEDSKMHCPPLRDYYEVSNNQEACDSFTLKVIATKPHVVME